MYPDKVMITYTEEHYIISVYEGDKLIKERKMVLGDGGAKATEKGDFYADFPDDDDLADALDDLGARVYDVYKVLRDSY